MKSARDVQRIIRGEIRRKWHEEATRRHGSAMERVIQANRDSHVEEQKPKPTVFVEVDF